MSEQQHSAPRQSATKSRPSGQTRSSSGPSPSTLARRAASELTELLGRPAEGVVSLERSEDGWRVGVEVVEVHRVPDTADVIAEYQVDVDRQGHLVGYRRLRRYPRGRTGDDR